MLKNVGGESASFLKSIGWSHLAKKISVCCVSSVTVLNSLHYLITAFTSLLCKGVWTIHYKPGSAPDGLAHIPLRWYISPFSYEYAELHLYEAWGVFLPNCCILYSKN